MAAPASSALPQMVASPTILYLGTDLYIIESIVGQGTFGTVAKCQRLSDSKAVAIKILKTDDFNIEAFEHEVSMLEEVQQLDPEKCNLVKWHGAFKTPGYAFLEFECLDKSLADLMRERHFRPLKLEEIRFIIKQVASTLVHLESINVTHADLKPENLMLVDQGLEPFKVKVIDFGLAQNLSSARQGMCIQTLPFRAPEVLLGLPCTTAVDMWSLGCIAAFLHQGSLLYPGRSPYENLQYIVQTQGQPEKTLLDMGIFTADYFKKDSSSSGWKLKTLKEYFGEKAGQFREKRKSPLNTLDDLLRHRPIHPGNNREDSRENFRDVEMFIDLLKGMLQLDPEHRLTPHQVLQHPFITKQTASAFAASTIEMTKVCPQSEGETSRKRKSTFVRDAGVTSGLGTKKKASDDQNTSAPKRQKRALDDDKTPKRKRSCISPQPSTSHPSKKQKTSEDFANNARSQKRFRRYYEYKRENL